MKVRANECRGMRERCGHIVAVADKRDGATPRRTPMLLQRQEIRERLTRMLVVGEGIDHVEPACRSSELLEYELRKRADDDRFHPALEIAGDVTHCLPPAERHVGL